MDVCMHVPLDGATGEAELGALLDLYTSAATPLGSAGGLFAASSTGAWGGLDGGGLFNDDEGGGDEDEDEQLAPVSTSAVHARVTSSAAGNSPAGGKGGAAGAGTEGAQRTKDAKAAAAPAAAAAVVQQADKQQRVPDPAAAAPVTTVTTATVGAARDRAGSVPRRATASPRNANKDAGGGERLPARSASATPLTDLGTLPGLRVPKRVRKLLADSSSSEEEEEEEDVSSTDGSKRGGHSSGPSRKGSGALPPQHGHQAPVGGHQAHGNREVSGSAASDASSDAAGSEADAKAGRMAHPHVHGPSNLGRPGHRSPSLARSSSGSSGSWGARREGRAAAAAGQQRKSGRGSMDRGPVFGGLWVDSPSRPDPMPLSKLFAAPHTHHHHHHHHHHHQRQGSGSDEEQDEQARGSSISDDDDDDDADDGDESTTSTTTTSSAPSSDSSDSNSSSHSGSKRARKEELRLHLLLGHLLQLAVAGGAGSALGGNSSSTSTGQGGGAQSQSSLPGLANYLASVKLLPRWVARVLATQPTWFAAAVNNQFAKEIRAAAAGGAGGTIRSGGAHSKQRPAARSRRPPPVPPGVDPSLVRSFWQPATAAATPAQSGMASRRVSSGGIAGSGEVHAAAAGGAGAGAGAGLKAEGANKHVDAAAVVSRYRSDFREEQRLGKGGFGLVVSAINGARSGHSVPALFCDGWGHGLMGCTVFAMVGPWAVQRHRCFITGGKQSGIFGGGCACEQLLVGSVAALFVVAALLW